MLPGLTGTLLTDGFVERLVTGNASGVPAAFTRALHRWWRRADRLLGPASSARAIVDLGAIPLFDALGYRIEHLEACGEGYAGVLTANGGSRKAVVALQTTAWGAEPDASWRSAVRAGRAASTRWAFIYTGPSLRIVDAARTWSRRSLDLELATAMRDERTASALVLLVQSAGGVASPPLEALVAESDAHGQAVCASLGAGVLDALTALVAALEAEAPAAMGATATSSGGADTTATAGDETTLTAGRDRGTPQLPRRRSPSRPARHPESDLSMRTAAALEQGLTIVYRLLFLLFAEARAAVPVWHHVYRAAYSVDALCRQSSERPPRPGLWKALQAISRLAHAGCRAGDLVVTPFNGRLFSPRHTPLGERARVPDAAVARTVRALALRETPAGQERIAYADLGVEQLGAVYERLLEYEPARQNGVLALTRTSLERKSTGSFYTPRSMTDFLVRRVLHPLVAGKRSDEILALRVLDPAMGSGAFLVSACRYLTHAVERALAAERPSALAVDARERAGIRRLVAQQCLFGVDLNPTAVQLARLSLWLTTVSADRPLTFLDHRLGTGNSLLGAALPQLTVPPLPPGAAGRAIADATLPLPFMDTAGTFAGQVLPDRFRLARDEADTPEGVRRKEQVLAELSSPGRPLARWKALADLWCAAWFGGDARLTPGVYHDVARALLGGDTALRAHQRQHLLERAAALARAHGFFHWDFEFPEVFFGPTGHRAPDGGFDAILGNPPWDVLRADAGDCRMRAHSREAQSAALRFYRDSGTYRHQGRGHANRYQLFVERALQLVRPGGRLGLLLPSGLATDRGSAPLRRLLLDTTRIDRLVGFENRQAVFPIHRDVRFLLVTATAAGRTETLSCALGHTDPAWLDALPDAAADDPPHARSVALGRPLLDRLAPDDLRWPLLASPADLDILAAVAGRVPALGDPTGWGAAFGRELNATDDRPHFAACRDTSPDLLRIVEGKHLEPFRLLPRGGGLCIDRARAAALVDPARTFLRARLAYRDVASATNRLTLIAAVLPPGVISTHTLSCLKTPLPEDVQYCLLALLNSLVANYLVRLQVTTHVTTSLMSRLPVPHPARGTRAFGRLATLARRLEGTGAAGGHGDYVELNTLAADLYGLTSTQYAHVLSTFRLLPAELRQALDESYRRATERRRRR